MAKHIITKDQLQAQINKALEDTALYAVRDPYGRVVNCTTKRARLIGKALVVLFERQTEAEKKINTTNVDNGIGFTGADGKSGGISAKTFLKRKTLEDWQVQRWTKTGSDGYSRIAKYWRQLDEAAKAKAKGELENA